MARSHHKPQQLEHLMARLGTSGQPETVPQKPMLEMPDASIARSVANTRKLVAAHKHLDKMFAQAEDEQIEGRRFFGYILLRVTFADGAAQDIQPEYKATDRVGGGR